MDEPVLEHSDSDSGDSWTLLDNSSDDQTILTNNRVISNSECNQDKDEDTDGISIISDSDPETPTFCDVNTANSDFEEISSVEQKTPQYIPIDPQSSTNIYNNVESEPMLIEDDILGEKRKHRIYVHRRNKKISTVLNIIMLGSIITAAGVAIGHMWGARNECSTNTIPSVNKILSNLYKLQEENAYLRNKLKELTSLNNLGYLQKNSVKQTKCKKVFEESLQNDNNVRPVVKCVDDKSNNMNKFEQPAFEKEYLADIDKLKTVYLQNKSLLDHQINQRFKRDTDAIKKIKNSQKFSKLNEIKEEKKSQESVVTMITPKNLINKENVSDEDRHYKSNIVINIEEKDIPFRKISYADSLKSNDKYKTIDKENSYKHESKSKYSNKKPKDAIDNVMDKSVSEEDFKKDNRYTGQKHTRDRLKHDRQKSHKKQKRRNKYEQWEMKGGFMKDYDELSVLSLNENDLIKNTIDLNQDSKEYKVAEKVHINMNPKLLGNEDRKVATSPKQRKANKTGKKINWYEERALLRNEARKKIEQELFGETSPNTAGWYFRRMHKREQCRAKADNTTYRKLPKHHMNFKIKH